MIRRVTSLLPPSKNMQFCNEHIRTQPLFSPPCASATYGSARMYRRKNWYIYTNIKMLPLKLHQASTWRIQGYVLSLVIPWKVSHLHYDVIVKKYFQHYWPFVRETTGGFPSRRTSDVEHWCSLWCQSEQSFEQTVHEHVIWYALKLIWRRCKDLQ